MSEGIPPPPSNADKISKIDTKLQSLAEDLGLSASSVEQSVFEIVKKVYPLTKSNPKLKPFIMAFIECTEKHAAFKKTKNHSDSVAFQEHYDSIEQSIVGLRSLLEQINSSPTTQFNNQDSAQIGQASVDAPSNGLAKVGRRSAESADGQLIVESAPAVEPASIVYEKLVSSILSERDRLAAAWLKLQYVKGIPALRALDAVACADVMNGISLLSRLVERSKESDDHLNNLMIKKMRRQAVGIIGQLQEGIKRLQNAAGLDEVTSGDSADGIPNIRRQRSAKHVPPADIPVKSSLPEDHSQKHRPEENNGLKKEIDVEYSSVSERLIELLLKVPDKNDISDIDSELARQLRSDIADLRMLYDKFASAANDPLANPAADQLKDVGRFLYLCDTIKDQISLLLDRVTETGVSDSLTLVPRPSGSVTQPHSPEGELMPHGQDPHITHPDDLLKRRRSELPIIEGVAEEVSPESLVVGANSFEELYNVIRALKTVKGRAGVFQAENLISAIEKVRQGRNDIVAITLALGIQKAVRRLLDSERHEGTMNNPAKDSDRKQSSQSYEQPPKEANDNTPGVIPLSDLTQNRLTEAESAEILLEYLEGGNNRTFGKEEKPRPPTDSQTVERESPESKQPVTAQKAEPMPGYTERLAKFDLENREYDAVRKQYAAALHEQTVRDATAGPLAFAKRWFGKGDRVAEEQFLALKERFATLEVKRVDAASERLALNEQTKDSLRRAGQLRSPQGIVSAKERSTTYEAALKNRFVLKRWQWENEIRQAALAEVARSREGSWSFKALNTAKSVAGVMGRHKGKIRLAVGTTIALSAAAFAAPGMAAAAGVTAGAMYAGRLGLSLGGGWAGSSLGRFIGGRMLQGATERQSIFEKQVQGTEKLSAANLRSLQGQAFQRAEDVQYYQKLKSGLTIGGGVLGGGAGFLAGQWADTSGVREQVQERVGRALNIPQVVPGDDVTHVWPDEQRNPQDRPNPNPEQRAATSYRVVPRDTLWAITQRELSSAFSNATPASRDSVTAQIMNELRQNAALREQVLGRQGSIDLIRPGDQINLERLRELIEARRSASPTEEIPLPPPAPPPAPPAPAPAPVGAPARVLTPTGESIGDTKFPAPPGSGRLPVTGNDPEAARIALRRASGGESVQERPEQVAQPGSGAAEVPKRGVNAAPPTADLRAQIQQRFGTEQAFVGARQALVDRIDQTVLGTWRILTGGAQSPFTTLSDVSLQELQRVRALPAPQLESYLQSRNITLNHYRSWDREMTALLNNLQRAGVQVPPTATVTRVIDLATLQAGPTVR
jgi:hypothetical protein